MKPSPRTIRGIAAFVVIVVACGVVAAAWGSTLLGERSWAPLPEEVPMPPAAPDDPAAYRGVTFRTLKDINAQSWVESEGQEVPWLTMPPGSYSENAGERGAPYFGYQYVLDGRRRMVWFYRLLEPPAVAIASQPSLTPAPPQLPVHGPGESPRDAAVKASSVTPPAPPEGRRPAPASPPTTAIEAAPLPDLPRPAQHGVATFAHPERAVLDVLVLPVARSGLGPYDTGCGPHPVIFDGDKGRLLNRTTGQIEPVDPDDYPCPED